jgi:hypothetical protein
MTRKPKTPIEMQMTRKPKTPTVQELQATIDAYRAKNKALVKQSCSAKQSQISAKDAGENYTELTDLKHQVFTLKEGLRELDPILKQELHPLSNLAEKSNQALSSKEIESIKKFIEKALHDAHLGLATESIKPALESLLLQRGEALTEVSFVKIDGKWRSTLSYVEFEELPDYTSYTPKFFSSVKNRVKVHSVDAETLEGSISGLKEPPPKKSLTSRYSRY